MYRRFLELLRLCGKKFSEMTKKFWDMTNAFLDVFKQCPEFSKRFFGLKKFLARFQNRIIRAVATMVFLVCLYAGAFAAPVEEHIISPEKPEQGYIADEKQPIIEKNPIFQATHSPDAIEGELADGNISDTIAGSGIANDNEIYIKLNKELGSAPGIGIRYVSGTCVNFRKAPNLDSEVLNKLYRNTEVELLSDGENGFSIVRYNGQIGYMYSEYLSETEIKIEYKPQYDYSSIANLRERIAVIAKSNQGTQPCLSGYCAKWVSGVYQAAGCGYPGGNAIDYWTRWGATGSTSLENIPIGAVVVGSGSGSALGNQYGHVGIYIGDGLVADNVGYHRVISLQEWVSYNAGVCHGYQGFIGWVWPYGQPIPE